MTRLLLIGLDEAEYKDIKNRIDGKVAWYPDLPQVKLEQGTLLVERPNVLNAYLPVDQVIFHGIFEDDYDLLTALALWDGPCLPNALGLLDCRRRIPGLARAVEVSRYRAMRRGFGYGNQRIKTSPGASVAKWGLWHCGEDKALIEEETESGDSWVCGEPTVVEPFITGEAVRIALIGEKYWQIHLDGAGWVKSIHSPESRFMDVDQRLLEDARRLARHFRLEMAGVDYMIDEEGEPHLLEVNHAPNVTVFSEIREAFIDLAEAWAAEARV